MSCTVDQTSHMTLSHDLLSQTLDEEVLNKKRVPEDVFAEAMNIIKECQEGSGEGIKSKAQELQNQFDELSQRTVETGELCEEATSAIQVGHMTC